MARTKTCGGCREKYPREPGHPPFRNWCSTDCAVTIARARQDRTRARAQAKAEKAHRAENRARRVALKTRAQHLNDAQTAFNAYIRLRDKDLPCVSCGRWHQGQWHASHYRSRGACSVLRFNEINVHKSCAPCNSHLSGNIGEYRIELVKRIGIDLVEWLESVNHPATWTIEDAKWIKKYYQNAVKQMMLTAGEAEPF